MKKMLINIIIKIITPPLVFAMLGLVMHVLYWLVSILFNPTPNEPKLMFWTCFFMALCGTVNLINSFQLIGGIYAWADEAF